MTNPQVIVWGPSPTCQSMATYLGVGGKSKVLALDSKEDSDIPLGNRLQALTPYLRRAVWLVLLWSPSHSLPVRIEPILQYCRQYRPGHGPPLRCLLLLEDTKALDALLQKVAAYSQDRYICLQVLVRPLQTARALLHRYPLHASADITSGQAIHVLIVGFGPLGQAVALQVMRLGHYFSTGPTITLWEKDKSLMGAFFAQQPHADQIAVFTWSDGEVPITPPTSIYIGSVSKQQEQVDLAQARKQATQQGWKAPIFFPYEAYPGAANSPAVLAQWDGQSIAFSPWQGIALQQNVNTQWERMAQTIHEFYCDNTRSQGRRPEDSPAGNPWSCLEETYKTASRHQADHMEIKLATIECRSLPQSRVEFFSFSQSEEEHLAIIEHARWAADRYLAGWTFGEPRNNTLRHHPNLIPYKQLSKALKDLDRYAVKLVPTLFARDYRVISRNLRLGIIAEYSQRPKQALLRMFRKQLLQLVRRFPQHCLVVESNLQTPCERSIARWALQNMDAAVRVHLCTGLPALLRQLESDADRVDFLRLLSTAERRVAQQNNQTYEDGLICHCDVVLFVGSTQHPHLLALQKKRENNEPAQVTALPRRYPSKRWIHIDPDLRACHWNFTY